MPERRTGSAVFNEESLREAIVSVWGEHGAHVLVFDHMLKLAHRAPLLEGQIQAFSAHHKIFHPTCLERPPSPPKRPPRLSDDARHARLGPRPFPIEESPHA